MAAFAAPLYGTCLMLTFAETFMTSVTRWPSDPTPADPYMSSPGRARAVASNAAGVLKGADAVTARIEGFCPTMATGANAAIGSYGSLGWVAAAVRKDDEVSSTVEPSRGDLATASAPMIPAAPGRLSTITVDSRRLPRGTAIM